MRLVPGKGRAFEISGDQMSRLHFTITIYGRWKAESGNSTCRYIIRQVA